MRKSRPRSLQYAASTSKVESPHGPGRNMRGFGWITRSQGVSVPVTPGTVQPYRAKSLRVGLIGSAAIPGRQKPPSPHGPRVSAAGRSDSNRQPLDPAEGQRRRIQAPDEKAASGSFLSAVPVRVPLSVAETGPSLPERSFDPGPEMVAGSPRHHPILIPKRRLGEIPEPRGPPE